MPDTDPMTTLTRAAVVAALLFLALAAVATFSPSSTDGGATCGTWVAPEPWEEASERFERQADEASGALADQIYVYAYAARSNGGECATKLETRRTVALGAFGLAVIAPAALVWVGRSRRPAPSQTEQHRAAVTSDTSTD